MLKYVKVYLDPDVMEIASALENAIENLVEPDPVLWSKISEIINVWQEDLWDVISTLPLKPNTLAIKKSLSGKDIPVGRDGKTKKGDPANIGKAGRRTGFLREKLTGEEEDPYTVPPFFATEDGVIYQYGIDQEVFYRRYPEYLADWIQDKMGGSRGIENLIDIDDAKAQFLSGFIFDEIWTKLEVELLKQGWTRTA